MNQKDAISSVTKQNTIINSDLQIKALRALLSTQTDSAKRAEIENFINKRIKELTNLE